MSSAALNAFKGLRSNESLVPFDKIDAALTAPGKAFEIETRYIHGRLVRTWKNIHKSLRDLWLASVKNFGPRTMIVAEGVESTYADVHQQVLLTAMWLSKEFHIAKGDRVAIVARNHVEFVVVFFAVAYLGAVPALINAFSRAETIYSCIREVGCKAVVVDVERFRRLRSDNVDYVAQLFGSAPPGCVDDFDCVPGAHAGVSGVAVLPKAIDGIVPKTKREWSSGKAGARVFDADELAHRYSTAAANPDAALSAIEVLPEDLCAILFTSGTTGKPKGIATTQRQFISAIPNSAYSRERAYARRGLTPPVPGPKEQSSGIILVPLFRSTGIQSFLIPNVLRGSKTCLLPKYNVNAAANMIEQQSIQAILGVGFMVRELMLSKYKLPSIRFISHGGSPTAKELPQECREMNPYVLVGQGYGSTEVNGAATALSGDDYLLRPSSAGRAAPVLEVCVIDPKTLMKAPSGQAGEIWIKGPSTALGYWGKRKETEEAFTKDGFFRTGDLGKMDDDQFVYILDRFKQVIIRGGENISCSEVEWAVYTERRIIDCAAVPIPHDRLGETVAVVCIPRIAYQKVNRPTIEDVLQAARSHLSKHEVPEFVWIRDEPLERNANGKVDKVILKEAVRAKFFAEKAAKLKSNM